jgi:hypothetical protein
MNLIQNRAKRQYLRILLHLPAIKFGDPDSFLLPYGAEGFIHHLSVLDGLIYDYYPLFWYVSRWRHRTKR